jgi:hypothetical protein
LRQRHDLRACFDGAVQQNNGFTAADPGWLHEIKHDGFRILAHRDAASDCLAVHHARSRRQSCNGSILRNPMGDATTGNTRHCNTNLPDHRLHGPDRERQSDEDERDKNAERVNATLMLSLARMPPIRPFGA